MKVIDKTTNTNKKEYDYDDVLKCWGSNPFLFDLYRIARAHSGLHGDCELDLLTGISDIKLGWDGTYDSPNNAVKDLRNVYGHIQKVHAVITISDLNDD